MKKITFLILCTSIISCAKKSNKQKTNISYPQTKKIPVIYDYFGTKITDNYRWLENDNSTETKAWVKAENKVTFNYLNKIPYRKKLKDRLSNLWNYEKIGTPFKEGNYYYFYKNNGLQNQSVLYRKKENDNVEEVFLNPNKLSNDGTTSLGNISFTKDGSLLAYTISEGGSDWRKIIVIKTSNKEIVGDTLVDVKFSNIAWKGNDGFYYCSYDKPKGSELSAKTDHHKLYYHKLGTSQKNDKLIFGKSENEKYRYLTGDLTKDQRFLIISASASTSGNKLFIKDLNKPKSKLISIINNFDSDTYVFHNKGTKLFLVTNLNAPNKKIVTIDFKNPTPENWKDLIPETKNVLSVSSGSGYIFAKYMVDAVSKIEQYDFNGKLIRNIKLPGIGTAGGFNGKEKDQYLYFSFSNYNTPRSSFKFNPKDGSYELYWKPNISFNSDEYQSKQIFYKSKDGTKIPMIITFKKGIKLNGKNPTILYGYGGFNVSLTPSFSISIAVWMEQGGIYAVANLRGGGEYGKKWHKAGIQLKKQNVFDDFIAGAEYLINKKYTSSDYLAIRGGSNGGLLVGAAMTQKPNLFKVALPAVGVLDMLRYHTFTAGAGWAYDYGTSKQSKKMFEYLKGYSPVHNVKKGTKYPATLITTGDHDDRVVPAHSFKFAAELQAKQIGNNPVLIRIENNAGHGAGTPLTKTIQQYADIFGFTLYNMGFKKLPSEINK